MEKGQRPDVPQRPARILAKVRLMHYFLLIVIVIFADHHSVPTMNQNQIINAIVRAAA